MIVRSGMLLGAVGVIIVIGHAAISAALHTSMPSFASGRGRSHSRGAGRSTGPAAPVVIAARPNFDALTVQQQGVQHPTAATAQTHGSGAAPAPDRAPAPAPASTAAPPAATRFSLGSLAPILVEGRNELGDSLFAVRAGGEVVVNFDASATRTRRADKFDAIVRRTLRSVYGAVADSLLATIPAGTLASPATLLTDATTAGIRIPAPNGETLVLRPETRPGRDGPLVVAYRASVVAR